MENVLYFISYLASYASSIFQLRSSGLHQMRSIATLFKTKKKKISFAVKKKIYLKIMLNENYFCLDIVKSLIERIRCWLYGLNHKIHFYSLIFESSRYALNILNLVCCKLLICDKVMKVYFTFSEL